MNRCKMDFNGKGVRIIQSEHMVVKRSLRERLFSRPWNPFRKYKPDDKILIMDDSVVYAHPETYKKLVEMIKNNLKRGG